MPAGHPLKANGSCNDGKKPTLELGRTLAIPYRHRELNSHDPLRCNEVRVPPAVFCFAFRHDRGVYYKRLPGESSPQRRDALEPCMGLLRSRLEDAGEEEIPRGWPEITRAFETANRSNWDDMADWLRTRQRAVGGGAARIVRTRRLAPAHLGSPSAPADDAGA